MKEVMEVRKDITRDRCGEMHLALDTILFAY